MRRSPVLLVLAAVTASASLLVPGPVATAAPPAPAAPAMTRYDGVFTGDLTLRSRAEYGGPDHRVGAADIDVTSRLHGVRFADARLLGTFGGGELAVSGSGRSTTISDAGQHDVTCEGDTVNPTTTVPPFMQPVAGRPTFYAFTSISLVETCTVTGEPGSYATRIRLPAIPVPVSIPASSVGATTITVPIDRTMPKTSCPDNEPQAVTCTYRLHGTLVLRLVPDIDVFQAPTEPVLNRRATKVGVRARCATACTATLEVRPLKGAGRQTTRATLEPRVGTPLRLRPGSRLRGAILRSGGARLEVTYRSGALTRTFATVVRVRR